MSRIRNKDTKPELIVRKYLFQNRFRYRLNVKNLPGKPDIVLTKYKTVIFINGCFWHGHKGCKYFIVPKTNTDWWLKKIIQNRKSDNESCSKLAELGWKVITIFECELKKGRKESTLNELIANIY